MLITNSWCIRCISKAYEIRTAPDCTISTARENTATEDWFSVFNLQPHFYDSTLCGKANWNNGKELLEVMFATTNQSEDLTLG